jgi:hypothetical protein
MPILMKKQMNPLNEKLQKIIKLSEEGRFGFRQE